MQYPPSIYYFHLVNTQKTERKKEKITLPLSLSDHHASNYKHDQTFPHWFERLYTSSQCRTWKPKASLYMGPGTAAKVLKL
uniref:Uncharacterized protein n=1 Tax=Rhizophora mucronata TaxID=61149 RepID=A0A2P2J590_RHIMU